MLKRHKDLVIILIILFSFYSFFTFILPGCTGQGKGDIAARGTETATLAQEPTPTPTATSTPTPQEPSAPAVIKYAYVSAALGEGVLVYNADDFSFVKKMEAPGVTPLKMCFSNTTRSGSLPKYLYAANVTNVKRFDLSTQLFDNNWSVNAGIGMCEDVQISVDDQIIYALGSDTQIYASYVDTQTELGISPITAPAGSALEDIKITQDGSYLITPDGRGKGAGGGFDIGNKPFNIPYIRTNNHSYLTEIQTNLGNPRNLAIDPNGTYAYILIINTNANIKKIAVLNITNKAIVNSVNLSYYPKGIVVSPNNQFVYVTNEQDNKVTVLLIDGQGAIAEQADKINVGQSPEYPALSSDGKYVWVPCMDENKVYVIRTSDNTVHKILDAQGTPFHALVE